MSLRHLLSIIFLTVLLANAQFVNIPISGMNNSLTFAKISEEHKVDLIGGFRLFKSRDNSNTFTELNLYPYNFDVVSYYSASIIDSINFVFVGGENTLNNVGKIMKTTDGGVSWTVPYNSQTQDGRILNDIEFNSSKMFCVGNNGTLLVSTDQGSTWNYINLGVNLDLKTIINFTNDPNTWMIGGEKVKFISTDNGATWQKSSLTYDITSLQYINNKIIENQKISATDNQIVVYDNNNLVLNSISSSEFNLNKSLLIPNNEIVSVSSYGFYLSKTTTNKTYFLNDSIHNNSSTNSLEIMDLEAGNNYMLAVGKFGGIGKYNFNTSLNPFLKSDFNFNISINCPNTPFSADAVYTHADSYKWYFDNVLISSNDSINFQTPSDENSHELKLEVIYNGNTKSTIRSIHIIQKPQPPNYTLSGDTSVCYNSFEIVKVTPPSNSNYYNIEFIRLSDGLVLYQPKLITTTTNFNTTNMALPDSFQIHMFKEYSCGTVSIYKNFHYTIEENLANTFQFVGKTDYCIGDTARVKLIQTNPEYTYRVYEINASSISTFQGNLTDTISIVVPVSSQYVKDYYIEVSSAPNCKVSNIFLGSYKIVSPAAKMSIEETFLTLGDTVDILNFSPKETNNWTTNPTPSTFNLNTNQAPTISSSVSGEFVLNLHTSTHNNCIDSAQRNFFFGDEMNINSPAATCFLKEFIPMQIIESKTDNLDNLIEIGYVKNYKYDRWFRTAQYMIRKTDAKGKLLWQHYTMPGNFIYDNFAAVFNNLDVDSLGNIYLSLFISADDVGNSYYDPLTGASYVRVSSGNRFGNYIVKLDPNGDKIFSKKINPELYTRNISDLKIKNSKLYYVLSSESNSIHVYTSDLNGNILKNDIISNNTPYSSSSYLSLTAPGNANQWIYTSPKLDVLSSGEIILNIEQGKSSIYSTSNYTYTSIANSNFLFKINTDNSVATKLIAENLYTNTADELIRSRSFEIKVNDEDNIYGVITWTNDTTSDGYNIPVIFENTQTGIKGSVFYKLDKNFNIIWQKKASYMKIYDIHEVKNKKEIIFTGSSNKNIGIERGNSLNTFDVIKNPYKNLKFPSIFYIVIDSLDSFNEAAFFNVDSEHYSSHISRTATNNSGDILFSTSIPIDYLQPTNLFYNNQIYPLDSAFIFKLSRSNCSPYLSISDNDTITVCKNLNVIHLPILEANNLSSIDYKIYDNTGLFVKSSFAEISDYMIDLYDIDLNSFVLKIYSNNQFLDSFFIKVNQFNSPYQLDYDTIMCKNAVQEIVSVGSNLKFYFQNYQSDSLSYHLTTNNTNSIYEVLVKIEDSLSCYTNDTLKIAVFNSINTIVKESSYCTNESNQLLIAEPTSFQHFWDNNNEENDTLIISQQLVSGLKSYLLKTIDTNSCEFQETVSILFYSPTNPGIENSYTLACDDSLLISLNLAQFQAFLWSTGNQTNQELFFSNNLENGSNYNNVYLKDIKGCSQIIEFNIDYCDLNLSEISKSKITVQPNPTNDKITVIFDLDVLNYSYRLISYDGKLIAKNKINQKLEEIDMSNQSNGMYFLYLENEKGEINFIEKIVKF
jgi:photosystem II stability/assembly factor-like uncharacterized protein